MDLSSTPPHLHHMGPVYDWPRLFTLRVDPHFDPISVLFASSSTHCWGILFFLVLTEAQQEFHRLDCRMLHMGQHMRIDAQGNGNIGMPLTTLTLTPRLSIRVAAVCRRS